jgi:KipI family sensor histidine kinase inhibitor
MRLLPSGDAAVLVELEPAAVLAFTDVLRQHPHPAMTDVVPAERTVLIRFEPALARPTQIADWLRSLPPGASQPPQGPLIELDVHYDGVDLEEVGRLTGLSVAEVVAIHTAAEWVVAFSGFAPGFGYLRATSDSTSGGVSGAAHDAERLAVPRRDESRIRVPAGSVALAAGYTGIYPRTSPGGWQLIGRTDAVLWDVDRDPPALLRPGVRVRFRDLGPQ